MGLFFQNKLSKPPANKQEYGLGQVTEVLNEVNRRTLLNVWRENHAGRPDQYPYLRQSAIDIEFLDAEFDLVLEIPELSVVLFGCSVTCKSTCTGFLAWEIAGWVGAPLNFLCILPELAAVDGVSAALICPKVM